ncbi:MAG: GNAT family N-acetyltransferase [Gammaproteobacteria bacterium]
MSDTTAPVLRPAAPGDFQAILAVINDGARAYRGAIPEDRWHDPYMSADALAREMADGIVFTLAEVDGEVAAVMGIQDRDEVELIRHAYVATAHQRRGLGALLLEELRAREQKPMLIGTWAAASWAIDFYRKHGFELVGEREKNQLLERYWNIPARQVELSVVLADARWHAAPVGLSP